MTSGANAVYVVTGANKGIGLALVQSLLTRPQTIVVGSVRSAAAQSQLLDSTAGVVPARGSKLAIVQLDYSKAPAPEDVRTRVEAALAKAGVEHSPRVDVLICNAGHTTTMRSVLDTPAADMRDLYEINTIGPLVTFQGLYPLLARAREESESAGEGVGSDDKAVFAVVSSSVGSIGMMEAMPGGAYGPSKAAANWIAKAVQKQYGGSDAAVPGMPQVGAGAGAGAGERRIASVALHPGFVKTAMGERAASSWSLPEQYGPNLTAEESAEGVLAVVDGIDKYEGRFVTEKGQELLW